MKAFRKQGYSLSQPLFFHRVYISRSVSLSLSFRLGVGLALFFFALFLYLKRQTDRCSCPSYILVYRRILGKEREKVVVFFFTPSSATGVVSPPPAGQTIQDEMRRRLCLNESRKVESFIYPRSGIYI